MEYCLLFSSIIFLKLFSTLEKILSKDSAQYGSLYGLKYLKYFHLFFHPMKYYQDQDH